MGDSMFNGRLQGFGGQADRWEQAKAVLSAFFASDGHAGNPHRGPFVDTDQEIGPFDAIGQGRLLLVASAVTGLAIMALGFEMMFWLYASDQDVAGRMDMPEQLVILVLALAAGALIALQMAHRQVLERADSQEIAHSSYDATEARREIAAYRNEIARQRQRIAELETRRILPPNVADERLALIGHDLRTPLNAVIGFSDLMAQEVYGPIGHPKYREYARHVRESGRALLGVAQDLLAMQAERNERMIEPHALTAQVKPTPPLASTPMVRPRDPKLDVEQAITRSLAGLRRTAEDLGAADRRPQRQTRAFGKRSAA
jgi:signal transduction histidine kinase